MYLYHRLSVSTVIDKILVFIYLTKRATCPSDRFSFVYRKVLDELTN